MIAAVASYFILNSIFTYWVWFVEGGEVFRGRRKSGELVLSSLANGFGFANGIVDDCWADYYSLLG